MKTSSPLSNNPAEMCGATQGDKACVLKRHEGDHVDSNGNRW